MGLRLIGVAAESDPAAGAALASHVANVTTAHSVDTRLTAAINAVWRPLVICQAAATSAQVTGAGDYIISGSGGLVTQSATGNQPVLVDLDTTEIASLRLRVGFIVNDTAPAMTFTFGVYPVGTPSGATNVINPNLGAIVAASAVAITTPAANSKAAPSSSGTFACPTTGKYSVAATASAAMAANSRFAANLRLEYLAA